MDSYPFVRFWQYLQGKKCADMRSYITECIRHTVYECTVQNEGHFQPRFWYFSKDWTFGFTKARIKFQNRIFERCLRAVKKASLELKVCKYDSVRKFHLTSKLIWFASKANLLQKSEKMDNIADLRAFPFPKLFLRQIIWKIRS